MSHITPITPCLWFDTDAEEAARFYTTVFPHSKITSVSHYGEAGQDIHGKPPGSVLMVAFELDGHAFTALNGGPAFKFSEAVSFQVICDTQDDIDRYWNTLGADGMPGACGWLKDRFGLSWQIVPARLPELMSSPDVASRGRTMNAMLGMRKLDIAVLERAAAG